MKDNIKIIIQAVTSALERGEHSSKTQAYIRTKFTPYWGHLGHEKEPSKKDSTVGQRAKAPPQRTRRQKASGEGLMVATITLSYAIDL